MAHGAKIAPDNYTQSDGSWLIRMNYNPSSWQRCVIGTTEYTPERISMTLKSWLSKNYDPNGIAASLNVGVHAVRIYAQKPETIPRSICKKFDEVRRHLDKIPKVQNAEAWAKERAQTQYSREQNRNKILTDKGINASRVFGLFARLHDWTDDPEAEFERIADLIDGRSGMTIKKWVRGIAKPSEASERKIRAALKFHKEQKKFYAKARKKLEEMTKTLDDEKRIARARRVVSLFSRLHDWKYGNAAELVKLTGISKSSISELRHGVRLLKSVESAEKILMAVEMHREWKKEQNMSKRNRLKKLTQGQSNQACSETSNEPKDTGTKNSMPFNLALKVEPTDEEREALATGRASSPTALVAQNAIVKSIAQDTIADFNGLVDKYNELLARSQGMAKEYKNMAEENAKLQQENAVIAQLNLDVKQAQDERDALKTALDKMTTEQQKSAESVAQSADAVKQALAKVQEITAERDDLKETLEAKDKGLADLHNKIRESERALAEKNKEIERLNKLLEDWESQDESQGEAVNLDESQVKVKTINWSDELHRQNMELLAKNTELEAEITRLKDITDADKQIAKLTEENAAMAEKLQIVYEYCFNERFGGVA